MVLVLGPLLGLDTPEGAGVLVGGGVRRGVGLADAGAGRGVALVAGCAAADVVGAGLAGWTAGGWCAGAEEVDGDAGRDAAAGTAAAVRVAEGDGTAVTDGWAWAARAWRRDRTAAPALCPRRWVRR